MPIWLPLAPAHLCEIFSPPETMDFLLFVLGMMSPNPGLMHLNLLSVAVWEKLRTSHCTSHCFVTSNVALTLPILIDSIVSLERIWKSFPEFAGVGKQCTAEVLEGLPWPLLMTSLEALCTGFLSFVLSPVADLVLYSVNLLILLEPPKFMSDPILTFECCLKPQVPKQK